MLARAIREGIGHDGRGLYWGMWYQSFAILSDEDVASVVVYLRTIPAVRNALPATRLPAEELQENAAYPKPITAPVVGPPPGDRLALGRYLVNLADCAGCHTSWYSPRNPGLLAGGNLIERGTRSAYSTNITRHESGTGYPTDTFIMVMRTGKGGSLSPVMPWVVFKGLSDDDLAAIHQALGSVQPVAHYIGNSGTPTALRCLRAGPSTRRIQSRRDSGGRAGRGAVAGPARRAVSLGRGRRHAVDSQRRRPPLRSRKRRSGDRVDCAVRNEVPRPGLGRTH